MLTKTRGYPSSGIRSVFFLFSDGLLLAKPAGGWIGGLVDVDSMDLPFEDWPWNFDLNGEIWMGRSLIVHKYN